MLRHAVVLAALLGAVTVEAQGQTVVGRVTAERDGAVLGSVAVTLLRPPNEAVREVLTDGEGRYRLVAPGAGEYRVVADHLGYHRLESPLLAITDDQTVTIDFELPTDPIEIEGVEVEVRRAEELRRRIVQYGVRLEQIGRRYVPRSEIERRLHSISIGQVLQWQNMPGVVVEYSVVPPRLCVRAVRLRARCALLVFDGAIVDSDFATSIPLEALEAAVVLTPVEATLSYGTAGGGGAVLLFSRASVAR